jgi:pyruvate dehydrogenase E1 component alpha subunit
MVQKEAAHFSVTYTQVLDEEGTIDKALMPKLSPDQIQTMYMCMNLARILDAKMLNLQKQGRIGTFGSVEGQEGCQAGLAMAIHGIENIWLVPSFREQAVLIARGFPMDHLLQFWGGYEIGHKVRRESRILPTAIPVGSQALHAVGLGMAMAIRKEKGAAITFFGDGATSEGELLEAMNFAGDFKTPTIFFCQNNQYAISVPRAKQSASETLAQKAAAFGFEGVQIDGNDVFAAYKIVKEAVAKALDGKGPTFIEAITYRMQHHTTADDWHRYRDPKEVELWKARDPIARLRKYMLANKMWDEQHEKVMTADAQKKVEEAVQSYMKTEKPKVEDIFDYLYEKLPKHVQIQKEHFVRFWEKNG